MRLRRRRQDVPSPFDFLIAAALGVDPPSQEDYGPKKPVDEFKVTDPKLLGKPSPHPEAVDSKDYVVLSDKELPP